MGLSSEESIKFFDTDLFPPRPWCFLNVTLVDIAGSIAQRLGVGVVHEDAWRLAEASWTVVVLE